MKKIYNFFKANRTQITFSKFLIMAILMMLSLKWTFFAEVLLAVSIIFALTEMDFDGFYIPFFLVNFRFVFRHNLGGNIPYVEIVFCIYAIFAVIKYLIIRKEKLKINWWVFGFSVAYIIWIAVSQIIFEFNFSEFAAHVLMIVMINFIFIFKDKIDLKKLIISFAFGVICAGIVEWITQYAFAGKFITMDMVVWDAHGNLRHRGLAGDPNYYSIDILIAIAGLYYLNSKENIKNDVASVCKKIIYYIAVFVLILLLYYTYSKSAIVGLGVFLLLITIFALTKSISEKKVKLLRNVLAIIAVIGFALLFVFVVLKADPFITFKRFSETYSQTGESPGGGSGQTGAIIDNITTGRWTLWKNHLEFCFSSVKNFVIGGGIGTHVGPMEAHNTYIQIFYETGFIGSCLIFGLFLSVVFALKLNKDDFKPKNWINFLIFLTGAFMFANVNYLAVTSFVYHLTLMFSCLKNKEDANDLEKQKEPKLYKRSEL